MSNEKEKLNDLVSSFDNSMGDLEPPKIYKKQDEPAKEENIKKDKKTKTEKKFKEKKPINKKMISKIVFSIISVISLILVIVLIKSGVAAKAPIDGYIEKAKSYDTKISTLTKVRNGLVSSDSQIQADEESTLITYMDERIEENQKKQDQLYEKAKDQKVKVWTSFLFAGLFLALAGASVTMIVTDKVPTDVPKVLKKKKE